MLNQHEIDVVNAKALSMLNGKPLQANMQWADLGEDEDAYELERRTKQLDAWHRKHKLGKYTEVLDDLTDGRTIFARYKGKAVMIEAKLTGGKVRCRYCPTAFLSSAETFDVPSHEFYTTIGSYCDCLI